MDIIEKLKKIKTLAERGCPNEKDVAKRLLIQLCDKYNIDYKSLTNEKKTRRGFYVGGLQEKQIFYQVKFYMNIKEDLWLFKGNKNRFVISLTDLEYMQFDSLYQFHKMNFKSEYKKTVELLIVAYFEKHSLFGESKGSADKSPLTKSEIKRLLDLMGSMDNKYFHTQIEGVGQAG